MKLKDKVAIVTGGGRGIGREIALAFAEEGADLVLAARTRSEIDAVAEEVNVLGRKTLVVTTDVRLEKQVNQMVERTIAELGRVDILVNDAGGFFGTANTPVRDLNLASWRVVLDTNLTGAFLCSKATLKYMIEQKSGNIINITSRLVKIGRAGTGAYSSAKSGLEGLTRVISREVAPFNIRVNALGPGGATATRPVLSNPSVRRDTLLPPRIIRKVAVYLASDDSTGVTGQSFDAQLWNDDQETTRKVLNMMRKVPH